MRPFVLGVTRRDDGDRVLLEVTGEIDVYSSHQLLRAIEDVAAGTPNQVVVDLSKVRFMDSTGVSALIRGRMVVAEHGGELVLHAPGPKVKNMLGVTGLLVLFRVTGA